MLDAFESLRLEGEEIARHLQRPGCWTPSQACDIRETRPPILVVQDNAEEAAMNRQSAIVVIYKAEPAELVHEVTHPRTGRADHLRQVILIDPWNHRFGSAFLAKMSKQQENPGQPFLA